MNGKVYSDRCPVHRQIIKTDRTQQFCLKRGGQIYDVPIFFCDRCRTYYVFIKELEENFTGRAWANNGYPIKVLGRRAVATTAIEQKKSQKKRGQSTRSIDVDGVIEVNVSPSGTKVPKTCLKCGKLTCTYIYKYVDTNGKEKMLVGKECPSCGSIYFTESIVQEHPKCFRIIGSTQKQNNYKSDIEDVEKNDTVNMPLQKPADNQEPKKKKREVFSTFCPEHNIVLRTPVMWKEGIPLFACPKCEKYYISTELYQYDSAVDIFRTWPVINTNLIVTNGLEPERKEKNSSEERIETDNKEPFMSVSGEKEAYASINLNIVSNDKETQEEKTEGLETEKAEEQRITRLDKENYESSIETEMQEVSQRHISEPEFASVGKIYTDDFGKEFDFSELEAVLIL